MKKVLFLYLKAFSYTGGIEKFNRSFLKALHELSIDECIDADTMSMYDIETNEKYLAKERFIGFKGNRILFVLKSVLCALKYDVVIIGHINLALVGFIIKKIRPSTKIIVIVHGIDIWDEQHGMKKRFIKLADCFLAVSSFTKNKMLETNPFLDPQKIKIFPNTIDSYFKIPKVFTKPDYLLKRYNILPEEKILLTITRLSSTEKYKGYDHVFNVLANVNSKSNCKVRYILGGKADDIEKRRIEELIEKNGVNDFVDVIGFIKDEELLDHYLMSDVFVMPSKKEGFGIVFIEAMTCGIKVIAGNKDGSVDALKNGEFGMLVNPDEEEELENAILNSLSLSSLNPKELQEKVVSEFGFSRYKERLKLILTS